VVSIYNKNNNIYYRDKYRVMSDDSIISEEILFEESLDESDAYTSAFDLDAVGNDQKNRANLSVSFNTKVQQFPIKVDSNSDDEYSKWYCNDLQLSDLAAGESFDEEDEDDRNETYDAYSNDFENDMSQSNIPEKSPISILKQKDSPKQKSRQESLSVLPSMEIEALQAELALQKLSREIVFLRNQQRESIHQRRAEVMEKKKRADNRRKSYTEELAKSRESESQLRLEVDRLTSANLTLTLAAKNIEESKQLSDEKLNDSLATLSTQRNDITALRSRVSEMEATAAAAEEDFAGREAVWQQEKVELEKQRMSLQNEVAMLCKNMEAAEKRYGYFYMLF
jgi:hypothetical protein